MFGTFFTPTRVQSTRPLPWASGYRSMCLVFSCWLANCGLSVKYQRHVTPPPPDLLIDVGVAVTGTEHDARLPRAVHVHNVVTDQLQHHRQSLHQQVAATSARDTRACVLHVQVRRPAVALCKFTPVEEMQGDWQRVTTLLWPQLLLLLLLLLLATVAATTTTTSLLLLLLLPLLLASATITAAASTTITVSATVTPILLVLLFCRFCYCYHRCC